MVFPTCGNTIIVDDQLSEILPLLTLLNKKGAPVMYFSGKMQELPDKPFDTVRLVFCDLKFSPVEEEKSIVANIQAILSRLISESNGPYILLIWSTREELYQSALQEALSKMTPKPAFVLTLSKVDYFEMIDEGNQFEHDLLLQINEFELNPDEKQALASSISTFSSKFFSAKFILKKDALTSIEHRLAERLAQVKLFNLFVHWENTIGKSALQTMNHVLSVIPSEIEQDKMHQALLYYLAKTKLDKQFDNSKTEQSFKAAMDLLDEMFVATCVSNVNELSASNIGIDSISPPNQKYSFSRSKFNMWKMINPKIGGLHPGNIYHDKKKSFDFHGMIIDSERSAVSKEISRNKQVQYIFLDISSDCDIAQKKLFVSRVVPGIIIPIDVYRKYSGKFKTGLPNYLFRSGEVLVHEVESIIIFNVNQLNYLELSELSDKDLVCRLTFPYLSYIKHMAGTCILNQGLEEFNAEM